MKIPGNTHKDITFSKNLNVQKHCLQTKRKFAILKIN